MIPIDCTAGSLSVDGDRLACPADRLPRKRRDVRHQRNVLGQVAPRVEERRERHGRRYHEQLVAPQCAGRMYRVEADEHAGAGVPDRRGVKQRRDAGDQPAT